MTEYILNGFNDEMEKIAKWSMAKMLRNVRNPQKVVQPRQALKPKLVTSSPKPVTTSPAPVKKPRTWNDVRSETKSFKSASEGHKHYLKNL